MTYLKLQLWIFIFKDVTQQYGDEAAKLLEENFLSSRRMGRNTAIYQDTTCCIIKPHIIASGMAGALIFEIQKAGYEISAIQTVCDFLYIVEYTPQICPVLKLNYIHF